MEMLLDHEGIEIDRGCKNGETLFFVSCERGLDTIVRALLNRADYDVNVDEPNDKQCMMTNPLFVALSNVNHSECLLVSIYFCPQTLQLREVISLPLCSCVHSLCYIQ